MNPSVTRKKLAVAVSAAVGVCAVVVGTATADKTPGRYVSGDIHNHTTCSDGSISMQKLVKKATDKVDTPWGLDWFVQAGHGGSGNRNCQLVEDATLSTPAYPFVSGKSPQTSWAESIGAANIKGDVSGSGEKQVMWRWQALQEVSYQMVEYLAKQKDVPLFLGIETVNPGHEHTSASVISGQMENAPLNVPGYTALGGYTAQGNATALAQWEYCFDRADTDLSRGNNKVTGQGNNWDCSVAGSANSSDPSWNATGRKLVPASGTGNGTKGHQKSVESVKWMKASHEAKSYYLPTHLERAGPFNPNGNNGFNVEHLRNFNNAAPNVAFGFETQPGHGASDARGEYTIRRNNIAGTNVDSVGGTTWGGTGVYGAVIGGVWDALLGEGRNYWFMASSDWHNRGIFGADDRRSSQDFLPGEYQRSYVMVRNGKDNAKLTPQAIVDGMRTGNIWSTQGQLIDRLAFVACTTSRAARGGRSDQAVEQLAIKAAIDGVDVDAPGCATMGEKLVVNPGQEIVVAIAVRDPAGTNYSPYTFDNPSLAQVNIKQPLNMPVLDHVDVIRGLVTGYKQPGAADYSGEWPRDWIGNPKLDNVPAGAKNTSAALIRTFNNQTWRTASQNGDVLVMSFRMQGVQQSQYVRLRGTNMPPNVPFETDANGNPLPDLYTNAAAVNPTVPNGTDGQPKGANLKIPCKSVGTTEFNGCPSHLAVVNGQKMVSFDVAAWSDLWFYSNPIYIEVQGSTVVAGVQ